MKENKDRVQGKEVKKLDLLRQIFGRCEELFAIGLETFPEKKTYQGHEVGVFAFTFNFGDTQPESVWIVGEKKHEFNQGWRLLEDYRNFSIRFSPQPNDNLGLQNLKTDEEDLEFRLRIFNFDKLETNIETYPHFYGIKPTTSLLRRVLKDLQRNVAGIRARIETKTDLEAILDFLEEIKEGKEKPRFLIESRFEEIRIPKAD